MQEYVVGFRIFDGRSLQSEDGGLCDPFVVVECAGHSYATETLENRATSSLVPWNEGSIWPNIQLSPSEFGSARIEFSVYARYWWSRNYLIGKASLQLSFVNRRKRHLYARRWLCLRRDDSPSCTGMLNVTVYALMPGNQAPSATEQMQVAEDPEEAAGEKGEDAEDLSTAVLKSTVQAPPGNPHYVRINISRVEDLAELGSFGGPPSPYVTVEFAGCIVPTAIARRVKVFTFNEEIVIPVITPIYEDTITVKLWSSNMLSPDELLAQGLISFSELRNNALPPRWFNLYGWNTDEISNVAAIAVQGNAPDPNAFKGRLLISGRVDRVEVDEELQKATRQPCNPQVEPNMMMFALLADVYMVTGAEGRFCRVEVSFGSAHKSTQLVTYDSEHPGSALVGTEEDDRDFQSQLGNMVDMEMPEGVNTFTFSESAGRIEPLLVMAPEDPISQPYVMVNVYTEGYLQRHQRIAYAKCPLSEFATYDHGNPSRPRFIALEAMPDLQMNRNPPSVLISIERHAHDDLVRHIRKRIKPMLYIVRAYCFLGRQLRHVGTQASTEPDSYALRVSCAGWSRTTKVLPGPRPGWMQHLDLKVILCSGSPKEAPSIEPITVSLVQRQSLLDRDLGKTVCVYTHMRQRDNLGQWEPYALDPQWIQIFGGQYGKEVVGEILVAFELLQWKHRDEVKLQPREMWPQPGESFDKREHFCRLRKATLHFSLQGLRDLVQLPNMESLGYMSGWCHVTHPMVTVEVSRFFKDEDCISDQQITLKYRPVLPGGDERIKADRLHTWTSKMGNSFEGSNFEFLQVGRMQVLIPDKQLLQPYIAIRVWERPSETGCALGYTPALIGESLQSLNPVLPCCWLEGIFPDRPYEDQKPLVRQMLERSKEECKVRGQFRQLTADELRQHLANTKQSSVTIPLKVQIISARGLGDVRRCEGIKPFCTCEISDRPISRIRSPTLPDISVPVWNYENKLLDYAVGDSLLFSVFDRGTSVENALVSAVLLPDQVYPDGFDGELPLSFDAEGDAHLRVKVTNSTQRARARKFLSQMKEEPHDFLSSEALPETLRVRQGERRELKPVPIDYINVQEMETFTPRCGEEVKPATSGSARRLVQGKLENSTSLPFVHDFWYKNVPLLRNNDIVKQDSEHVDWNFQPGQTFGFVKCTFKLVDGWEGDDRQEDEEDGGDLDELYDEPDEDKLKRSFQFDPHLNMYAFNETKLRHNFKSPEKVPSRVRLRIYLLKAFCIYGKTGSFADPYPCFQLGSNINVSMRNMAKLSTNTPDFYHIEQRDIQLPFDGRLEIAIMDRDETSLTGDALIGSTVIDLEERWHSREWRKANALQKVPIESRSLFTAELPGKNRGSLEMWVEMIETTKASDQKPSNIRKPPELEIEVRLVIWGTTGVPAFKDDYTNVKISSMLDCKEYSGAEPPTQDTDVHFACRDGSAAFSWRVVYSGIQMPVFSCGVQLSLFHSELIMGDTFIGSLNLDLKKYVERVSSDLTARELGPTDLKFQAADAEAEDEGVGSVSVSLYVMTQMEANTRKQGLARDEPNSDPQLITPTLGREWGAYLSTFGFAWPDFGLFKKLLPLLIAGVGFLVSVIALKQLGVM